jgi:hypothetical protein
LHDLAFSIVECIPQARRPILYANVDLDPEMEVDE